MTMIALASMAAAALSLPKLSTRRGTLIAAAVAVASPVRPAVAQEFLVTSPVRPATPQSQETRSMELLMNAHAKRFDTTAQYPSKISSLIFEGQTIRQLVATADVPQGTLVAAYPVEVMSDDGPEFDTMYAVGIDSEQWVSGQLVQGQFEDVSGIPTRKSLARTYRDGLPTIAMFANEPDDETLPNCLLNFPTVRALRGKPRVRVGDVYCAYLETITKVRSGEPLTWCYGSTYIDRGYPTTCP